MRLPTRFALAVLSIASLGSALPTALPVAAAEQPLVPEKNPPGDIPDSQVFVTFTSPLGFEVKAPEGWSRQEHSDGVRFADKYGAVDVAISAASGVPTPATVKAAEAAALEKDGRAVTIGKIKAVTLPSGPAVLVTYTSNSEPNAVTGKRIRLEHDRFLIVKGGKLATLDFSAPAGADNADQWKLMSDSFGWK